MEINEKLLRQIIEDVLSEMKGSDKPVSFNAPAASAAPQATPPAGDGCAEAAEWIKNRIDPSRVKPVPPDPDYRHPRTFRLSEMPRQCQAVATAR